MKKEFKFLIMGKLVNTLSNIVESSHRKIVSEAISKRMMQTLLNKFQPDTDDSPETIKKYVNAFDRFKQSLPPNQRDLQRYSYRDLKYIIDERIAKQKRKKDEDTILSVYMGDEKLGKGMNIDDVRLLLRQFNEIKSFLPKGQQDILKVPGAKLSRLISSKFNDLFTEKIFKKFKEDGLDVTDEEILTRIERYINAYDEVPKYTKPVVDMTFDEFEKVADVLPVKDEDETSGEIDVSDVEVVYEDDDVLIFHPDEKQKCINIRKKYAPDRGWCTSWEGSGNYYYNYRLNQNLTLYYIINKNLDLSDKDFASVILVEPYSGRMRLADGTNRGRYAGGTVIDWKEITEKIPVIKDKKELFKAKPLTDEEQAEMKQMRGANVSRDAVKELGSEKRAELWLELSTPNLTRSRGGEEIYANLPDYLKKKYIGLGGDLNAQMVNDSSAEVIKYMLAKKKEALMNKNIDRLTDTDIALLNSPVMKPVKDKLKSKYMDEITKKSSAGDEVFVNYPRDNSSKFIALYGFEDFFNSLPDSLTRLDFINEGATLDLHLPPSISRFKKLIVIHITGCLSELPKEVSELTELMFISLADNPRLTTLPVQLADKSGNEYKMKDLSLINLKNVSPAFKLPAEIQKMVADKGITVLD